MQGEHWTPVNQISAYICLDSAVVSPDQPCHPPTWSVQQSMCFAHHNPLIQPTAKPQQESERETA